MRLTEQATLQNGATAYMNVLRDAAVVNLRKNNIAVLEQQLKQTRDRSQVGEVTRTDVAQAEASVAQAQSELYAAQAQLKNSVANYRQIIGVEPTHLEPGRSLEPLLPRSLHQAIEISLVLEDCPVEYKEAQDEGNRLLADLQAMLPQEQAEAVMKQVNSRISADQAGAVALAYALEHE